MPAGPIITLANAALTARISALGAELQSLVPAWGDELMWQADPAVWNWHAPNLFPVVGALAKDTLIHQGVRYEMPAHGFLRHSLTEVIAQSADAVVFRLTDNPETRCHYPFAFTLTLAFHLEDEGRPVRNFGHRVGAAEQHTPNLRRRRRFGHRDGIRGLSAFRPVD